MPSESINDDARCRRVITYGLVIWRERNMQHNQSRSRDSPAFGFHPTSFCDLGTKLYGDDDTGDEALRRDFAAAFKRLTELGFVEFPPITQFPADAAVRGDVARCPFNEHGYGYPPTTATFDASASGESTMAVIAATAADPTKVGRCPFHHGGAAAADATKPPLAAVKSEASAEQPPSAKHEPRTATEGFPNHSVTEDNIDEAPAKQSGQETASAPHTATVVVPSPPTAPRERSNVQCSVFFCRPTWQ